MYAGSIGLSMPVSCYNVYRYSSINTFFLIQNLIRVVNFEILCIFLCRSYKDKTGKMRPYLEGLKPLFSSIFLMFITTVWVYLSPVDILEVEPRMFFYMMGTIFSHICCRLIVAQMSSTKCEAFDWLLFPTTALAVVSVALRPGPIFEVMAVYVLAVLSTLTQIHYGVYIVRQMCRHFRIDCFKIKDKTNSDWLLADSAWILWRITTVHHF